MSFVQDHYNWLHTYQAVSKSVAKAKPTVGHFSDSFFHSISLLLLFFFWSVFLFPSSSLFSLLLPPSIFPLTKQNRDLRQNEILDVKDGTFQGYSHLEELILFQNNLTATRPGMFAGLKNLKTLLLNSNNISKIDRDTFSGLNNLKLLSLYDNRIETLEEGTFDSLRDIQILHLGKNPFRCDCNLRSLAEYLNGNPIETSGAKCESPKRYSKRKITAVDYNRMGCRGESHYLHQGFPVLCFSL